MDTSTKEEIVGYCGNFGILCRDCAQARWGPIGTAEFVGPDPFDPFDLGPIEVASVHGGVPLVVFGGTVCTLRPCDGDAFQPWGARCRLCEVVIYPESPRDPDWVD